MHDTPEYAEDLLQRTPPQVPMGHGATSSSAGVAQPEGSDGIAVRVLPPVPDWWSKIKAAQVRSSPPETPRFDEVYESPRRSNLSTPRTKVGGDFQSPRQSPRVVVTAPNGKAVVSQLQEPCASKSEEIYEGAFLGTMRHGLGKLRMASCTYEGEFVHDMKHGTGRLHWDDGRQYCGQFTCNKFGGSAIMTWPDGRAYSGQYADDRKHGEGIFSWSDGRRYEGQWICGKRHGIGLYTNAKGITRQGYWQKDRPLRWDPPGTEESSSRVSSSNSAALSPSKASAARSGAYPPQVPEDRVVFQLCNQVQSSSEPPYHHPLPRGDDGLPDPPQPTGSGALDACTTESQAANVADAADAVKAAIQTDNGGTIQATEQEIEPNLERDSGGCLDDIEAGPSAAATGCIDVDELAQRLSPQPAEASLSPEGSCRENTPARAHMESAQAADVATVQSSLLHDALVDAAAEVGVNVVSHGSSSLFGTEMHQNGTACEAEASTCMETTVANIQTDLHQKTLASSSDAVNTAVAVQQQPQRLPEADVDLDMQARLTQAAASVGIEVVRKPKLRLPAGGMQPDHPGVNSFLHCDPSIIAI